MERRLMARLKKYALYKGDELIAEGTIEQISQKMGIPQNTVRFYKTPASKRRYNPETRTALVEADYYDKPEDFSDCFAWTGVFKTPCAALNVTFCDWENCKFYKRK